jgi:hypothetical protein
MITLRARRGFAALFAGAALVASAVVTAAPAAAVSGPASPSGPASGASASDAVGGGADAAAPRTCPLLKDPIVAAIDREVRVEKITPKPSWRKACGTLYRSDSRGPKTIFEEGFTARAVKDGEYDIKKYVLTNKQSPYVSTTYDHDLYKGWDNSEYNYYIDAPGGIDVNKTIGTAHKYANEVEVAFPGGIKRDFIVGVCPVDQKTKVEILSDCESNPHFTVWH